MRLLNTNTLELSRLFFSGEEPDYVILSHRWSDEEVTFADISKTPISDKKSQARKKNGFSKVEGACEQARRDGYEWIWIDSCCIDKSSSAELQEAINSMWRYYKESNICYVYLADVSNAEAGWGESFAQSDWFNRGWTLQELLAPLSVEFYAQNWQPIGTRSERHLQVAEITSIDPDVLVHRRKIPDLSAAERMSWAAHRRVSKEEDQAYSLLGLFDINMPLLYGEGQFKAFSRLQEAIYNSTTDSSLFLYRYAPKRMIQPLIAISPRWFCERRDCVTCRSQFASCLSSGFRYTELMKINLLGIQTHEQIVTTANTHGSAVSTTTTLSLLEYKEISSHIICFDDDRPLSCFTHVAVLHWTLKQFPYSALCILLQRWHGADTGVRGQTFPIILRAPKGVLARAEKVRFRITCTLVPRRYTTYVDATFTFESASFTLKDWHLEGFSSGVPIVSQIRDNVTFGFQATLDNDPGLVNLQGVISCQIAACQGPELTLWIDVSKQVDRESWFISRVYLQRRHIEGRIERHILAMSTYTDRCTCQVPDGRRLIVQVRRLAGSARASQDEEAGEGVLKTRYRISAELNGM